MTLAEAAESTGKPIGDLICDLLIDSDMAVGCVVPHQRRTGEDIRQLMRHPCMTAGSGRHPMLAAIRIRAAAAASPVTWATTSATSRPGDSRRRCSTCRRIALAASD